MNPFRSRKKSMTKADAGSRPTLVDAPPLPTSRGRTFRRKKPQPEPKKEIDIAAALPPTDDFRTSLLMSNLSARFSMLREQDDPNSKLGKANDDSVLYPKRASRLGLFGDGGLADIAEVSSISGSIRPPFANERANSYSSADGGYGTDDDSMYHGSVMGRSKPGQGNKFFGGRQKVYKIPVGAPSSAKELNQAGSGPKDKPMGKAVYDDDINLSAFQQLRKKEKEEQGVHGRLSDERERNSKEERRGSPPPLGYNRNRETSSSTTSGPNEGRTSTAATSIASQGASPLHATAPSNPALAALKQSSFSNSNHERGGKGKRLYGHGLDQHIHEQQFSAMHRLNSIQKGHGINANGVNQSRSATNMNERFQKHGLRTVSPPPGAAPSFGGFDFGTNDFRSRSNSRDKDNPSHPSPAISAGSAPMSPESPLVAALSPNDLGKATASGAFNKPKTPYNEQQYAQRQLQLQEGRETPPPRGFSRNGSNVEMASRLRNDSFASQRSADSARSRTQPTVRSSASSSLREESKALGEQQAVKGAFLAEFSGSESSEPGSPEFPTLKASTHQNPRHGVQGIANANRYEHDDQHPAFKSSSSYLVDSPTEPQAKQEPLAKIGENQFHGVERPPPEINGYSEAGLSDLVKGHLRNYSNQSSIYPDTPPRTSEEFPPSGRQVDAFKNLDARAQMPPPLSTRARQILDQANHLRSANSKAHDVLGGFGGDKAQQVLGNEAPRRSRESSKRPSSHDSPNMPWQDQMKGHVRGASTETQKEREDFANELADRRKQVEDNLKSVVGEENIASNTPGANRSHDNSPMKHGPLGLAKKPSQGSMNGWKDNQLKAMKMLGVTGVLSNGHPQGPHPERSGENRKVRLGDENNRGQFLPPGEQRPRMGPGAGPSFRERSIGTERRENFFRKGPFSPAPPSGRSVPLTMRQPPPNNQGFAHPPANQANGPAMSYRPAGRARKYSPPRHDVRPTGPSKEMPPPTSRSNSSMSHRQAVPQDRPFNAGSHFPPHPQSSISQTPGYPSPISDSPRPSPVASGFSANKPPSLEMPPSQQTSSDAPTMISPNASTHPQPPATNVRSPHKRSINKHEISEPTFLSGTSSVITVDLPPGASLANGMVKVRSADGAPPVPPINPRRRRIPTTQNVFTAFGNESIGGSHSTPSSAHPTDGSGGMFGGGGAGVSESPDGPCKERSTFSADEGEPKPKGQMRLRKTSSEGGSLAAKARQQAFARDAENMPASPMVSDEDNRRKGLKGFF